MGIPYSCIVVPVVQVCSIVFFLGTKPKSIKIMGKLGPVAKENLSEDENLALNDIGVTVVSEFTRGWIKGGLYISTIKFASKKEHFDSCIYFIKDGNYGYGLVYRMFLNDNEMPLVLVKCIMLDDVEQLSMYDDDVGSNLLNFVKTGFVTNYVEAVNVEDIIEKVFCTVNDKLCHLISLVSFAEIQ